MSEQALDLRKSAQIVGRYKIVVCIFAALGLLAGVGWTLYRPPMLSSVVLIDVVLPSSEQAGAPVQAGVASINPMVATQMVIADSTPVLRSALRTIGPSMPLQTLQRRIQVTNMASTNIITISAEGKTATQAEQTANAVASSYVASTRNITGGQVQARVLESANSASGRSLLSRMTLVGVAGILLGAMVGVIAVLAFSRRDRRLRTRDEIADSIGVPVLASIRAVRPSGAAGWAKLLADYQPGAADEWRLRKAMRLLDLAKVNLSDAQIGAWSLEVISFGFDSRALALGPQLAVYAASQGIPTALVVGPQQNVKAAATLRTACAAPPSPSSQLQVFVRDHDGGARPRDVMLTVLVTVVDDQNPQVSHTTRATATVLGVSAGAATADQIARAAASAAAAGRDVISGILVADPDPNDHTTGRLPQLSRSAHWRGPTRLTGIAAETTP